MDKVVWVASIGTSIPDAKYFAGNVKEMQHMFTCLQAEMSVRFAVASYHKWENWVEQSGLPEIVLVVDEELNLGVVELNIKEFGMKTGVRLVKREKEGQ